MSNDDQEKTPKEEAIKADFRKVKRDFKDLFSKIVQKLGPIAKKVLPLIKKAGAFIITFTKKGFHFLMNVLKNLKKKKAPNNPPPSNQAPRSDGL